MARTLIEVYLHVAFSTKHRAGIIHPEIEAELHRYIAGIIANLDSRCIAVNGRQDGIRRVLRGAIGTARRAPLHRGTEGAPPARVLRRGVGVTTRRARCRIRRTISLGLKMRPLRGRCVRAGNSAGHARARCTRPRATHGYYIDRSAVADLTAPRSRN